MSKFVPNLICSKNDPHLFSIDKISFEKNTDCVIYDIEYFKNFNNKNSLYLVFDNVDAYVEYNPTEDDSQTKYLVFASKDKNREPLENTQNFGMKLKIKLRQ